MTVVDRAAAQIAKIPPTVPIVHCLWVEGGRQERLLAKGHALCEEIIRSNKAIQLDHCYVPCATRAEAELIRDYFASAGAA